MVVHQFPMFERNVRWLGYLALSLGINWLIVLNIKMGAADVVPAKMASLSIAIKTIVMPKLVQESQPSITETKTSQPTQVNTKKANNTTKKSVAKTPVAKSVVTSSTAENQIKIQQPKADESAMSSLKAAQLTEDAKPLSADVPISEPEQAESMMPASELASYQAKVNVKTNVDDRAAAKASFSAQQDSEVVTKIKEAQYRKKIPPNYPNRALELGQQGVVTLHAKVMPSGHPDEIKVASSSGYRLLDKAALAAVKKWEFVPTNINGQATVSWVSVPVNFTIQ